MACVGVKGVAVDAVWGLLGGEEEDGAGVGFGGGGGGCLMMVLLLFSYLIRLLEGVFGTHGGEAFRGRLGGLCRWGS